MNLTSLYCQTPFTLSMDRKVAALRKMHAENLHHYDAHCPRCGRANTISCERLEMFTPRWEEAIGAPQPQRSRASSVPAAPLEATTPLEAELLEQARKLQEGGSARADRQGKRSGRAPKIKVHRADILPDACCLDRPAAVGRRNRFNPAGPYEHQI